GGVPPAARALVRGLLCAREARLGRGGARDFRGLRFFAGLRWERLRQTPPPFGPATTPATATDPATDPDPADTSNFDLLDD
ncbi:DMPK kinase, partial [Alcedo cyanopectus]|nr:DMPK kinase [Ceyx cyanopectus]